MKIFLSIEVTSRELESRTLLASYAAKHGFEVVMGRKKELIDQALVSEPGIFLSQWGLHRNFKALYKALKSLGHTIITLDEEGLVTLGFEDYVTTKVDSECLALVDKVLLWGRAQENDFKNRFPEYSSKFEAVGNPRDDILDDTFDALFAKSAVKSDAFDYAPITFVSSFGFANHLEGGDEYFEKSTQNGVFFNDEVEKIFRNYFSFQKDNFATFVNLIKTVAETFPDRNIIYRCHPAENREILVTEFGSYKNITFSFGGALVPLLKRSELVVHHYCHAGIEAQILGKITIAYRAKRDSGIEDERVYSDSISLSVEAEVISVIEAILSAATPDSQVQRSAVINDFIFRSDDELASERIVSTFVKFSKMDLNRNTRHFLIAKKKLLGFMKGLRAAQDSYTDQKSEGLTHKAIRNILDTILQVAPRGGRYIEVREITPCVFKLTAANT